nr:hypothetical protein [Candidatus Sigynarchaeota archaeon]
MRNTMSIFTSGSRLAGAYCHRYHPCFKKRWTFPSTGTTCQGPSKGGFAMAGSMPVTP